MVIGRKTMFIRTGGCDYSCAWCDSKFTWDGSEKAKMMTPEEIMEDLCALGTIFHLENGEQVPQRNFDHVTISGGNPALIGEPMNDLIALLQDNNIRVGLETQGTRWQRWMQFVDDMTISPKPPSSHMITDFDKLTALMHNIDRARGITIFNSSLEGVSINRNYTLKVVVFDDADYAFAQDVHQRYPHVPFYLSVGNIDAKEQGDISGRLLEKLGWLWDKVIHDPIMNDARPLPQLHTLVWANRRAV